MFRSLLELALLPAAVGGAVLGEGFTKPGSALAEGATLHAGSRPSAPNTHPSPNIAFKSYLGMSTKDIEVGPPSYDNHPEEEAAEAEEERLPLYGGFQYEHAGAHQDDLPTNAASPNEVRDFIVHVLVSRRQLPVDHARRIATRWTIGSGLEMRSYPASMYLELFGSEDGWILYREIKLMMHAEANRKFMHRYMSHILTAVLVLVTAFSILLIVLNMDDGNTLWFIAGLFGTLFASIGLLIRLLILFFATCPESEIVGQLSRAAERHGGRSDREHS